MIATFDGSEVLAPLGTLDSHQTVVPSILLGRSWGPARLGGVEDDFG
jgi:hypothetical protein